ncbi:hypothetical protein T10_5442 [Trichinella papuae]|uniref:Uncharacterized protein n=1 Tax=Trichinella papuae TaxID=268474 RepID=A0A0V1M6H7_9BILA|nr:hypothetical protein T10_5442 [Trichinella papuae]
MTYTCQRPDETLTKNQHETMLNSGSKILTHAVDQSKQLDTVFCGCLSFFDQLEQLYRRYDELEIEFRKID